MNANALRFRLYVIELGTYPSADGRTAIYVGSTRLSRRQRWHEHRTGAYTASRRVTKYGTRRLPELARGTGTYPTRDAAEQAEHQLRLDLEDRGYRVFGGSGRPMPRRPRRGGVADGVRKGSS